LADRVNLKLLVSLVSVLLAFGFVVFGATALFSEEAPVLVRVFGACSVLHGVAAVALLIIGWRSPSRRWARLAAVLSTAFVVLWIVGSFDYGTMSGLEIAGVMVVALAATVNWYAVRLIVGEAA
jgi:hypothetical protein